MGFAISSIFPGQGSLGSGPVKPVCRLTFQRNYAPLPIPFYEVLLHRSTGEGEAAGQRP
jgi:hypothetical protein